MLEILYDISEKFEIPVLDGDEYSILVSSDDDTSCNIMYNILASAFSNNELVFKATGLPDNISCILEKIHDCNPVYFQGDSKKLFIKKRPEVYAKIIDQNILKSIINKWVSTVYERRYIYIVQKGQYDCLCDILRKSVYVETNNISHAWPCLDCLIENAPDAENNNTFILTFRKKYLGDIKSLLTAN